MRLSISATLWPFNHVSADLAVSVALLVISVLLLVIEVVVVLAVRREPREREKHLFEIKRYTSILGREAYVLTIEREIRKAQSRICLYWHSLNTPGPAEDPEISDSYQAINTVLLKKQREDNVPVTLIVAKEVSRIPGAYILRAEGHGIAVYFEDQLKFSDLRFSLFDSEVTVFGTPEPDGDAERPSRYGVDIRSDMLAKLMDTHFTTCKTTSYEAYVAAESYKAIEGEGLPKRMVADRLKIPEAEIDRCQAQAPDVCVLEEDE